LPDILTIRECCQRAQADGMPVSEYTLRRWVRSGTIPARKIGQKALIFYPNFVRHLQCADGSDNTPATAQSAGIRRADQ